MVCGPASHLYKDSDGIIAWFLLAPKVKVSSVLCVIYRANHRFILHLMYARLFAHGAYRLFMGEALRR